MEGKVAVSRVSMLRLYSSARSAALASQQITFFNPTDVNPASDQEELMKHQNKMSIRILSIALVFSFLSFVAQAATVHLKASLKSSGDANITGTGTLTATLDTVTNEFKYHIEFSGLTGAVVAAHFHGPAADGENAKPQLPVKTSPIASPIDGTATLTPEQAKDLADGKWYFNLHTAANPKGEIRGQVVASE